MSFDTSPLKDPIFVRTVYSQTYQFLPQETKDELRETLNEYQTVLDNTIKYSSSLRGVIIGVRNILTSLGKTGQTLNIVGNSISIATNAILTLPIPTSVPPGVGLPLNLITQLSQNLDRLSIQSEKVEGASELIEDSIPPINDRLDKTIDTLNVIIDVITIILDIIIFLQYAARS